MPLVRNGCLSTKSSKQNALATAEYVLPTVNEKYKMSIFDKTIELMSKSEK